MSGSDVFTILPLLILSAAPVILMLAVAVHRNHFASFLISLIFYFAAFISLFYVGEYTPRQITPLFIVDNYALFYIGLIVAASFAVTLLSFNYIEKYSGHKDEYYMLLFLASLGASVLVVSNNFVSLFLGLEILSVSLYVLISYVENYEKAIEAGVKYLILAAASSAFLLFGIALLYAELGTMSFGGIASVIAKTGITPLVLTGFAMITVGFGFKLAVVPFHMWTPDVYEGASAPVTAFIATISKGGMFAVLLRFFSTIDGYGYPSLISAFTVIAIASMLIGNWLAIKQNNVKRILAYSSIAHLGYLLVAFIAGGNVSVQAVTFYLVAYFITTLGAFGIITILSDKNREADTIEDYKGLFWRKPVIAAIFTAMLFSLAGIPLTVGFIGKYFLLSAGVNASRWLLVIVLVLSSVIGLYYYLRIITAMFSKEETQTEKTTPVFSLTGSTAILVLTVMLIWYGVYPTGLLEIIRIMIGGF